MKNFLFSIISIFVTSYLFAQYPTGDKNNSAGRQLNAGHFYGKVIDDKTGKGIEFATVQLFQNSSDTINKKSKRKLLTGALTESNGDFTLDNLPLMGDFLLRVSAIGYDTVDQKVSFGIKFDQNTNMQQMMNAADKDLGNIKLKPLAIELSEVVVSGEEPLYHLELDKKVYNVEKDPSSAGGTAEDVLKKIPSVNVDIDGNVSLRNASPQIFVDGRPTTLTIDQIPSDVIEKIEVITNPSAKYDASGGQSGIINIVMKKNRRIGYNGNLRAGIDMRGKVNGGGDINLRQGKINLFASGNFNQRKSITFNSTDRYDGTGTPLINFFQVDTPINNNQFIFGSAGFDYFLNNRNTITLSGNYTTGKFHSTDNIYLTTDTMWEAFNTSSNAIRSTDNTRNFHNAGGSLQYKHLFPQEGKEWTADLNYNQSSSENNGIFNTQYYDDLHVPVGTLEQQQQKGSGANKFFTAQTDFDDPISDKMKIEAGARTAVRSFTSENHVLVFDDSLQTFVEVPDLNNYIFDDQVYAGYLTFSQQVKKFQYQLGLRGESSFYTGKLTDSNQSFTNNFPISLFPSGFVTYALNKNSDIQLNYTRRIDRPTFFQLLPFTDYSDSLNLQRGNPDLKPQFTNTIELTYEYNFDKSNTLLASGYFKNTDNLITRFQQLQYDSIFQTEVIINTYENASYSNLYGIELTSMNTIKKWITLSTNFNLYESYINGSNIEGDLTNKQLSWLAKLNATFKLPADFTFQLSGDYQSKASVPQGGSSGFGGGGGRGMGGGFFGSPPATIQGYVKPVYGIDVSLKKEFFKKAASVTLSFSDILRTRKYSTFYHTDFFTQTSERIRDPQFVRLNFSFKFGKFDAALFKRKNTRNTNDMLQDVQPGMQ